MKLQWKYKSLLLKMLGNDNNWFPMIISAGEKASWEFHLYVLQRIDDGKLQTLLVLCLNFFVNALMPIAKFVILCPWPVSFSTSYIYLTMYFSVRWWNMQIHHSESESSGNRWFRKRNSLPKLSTLQWSPHKTGIVLQYHVSEVGTPLKWLPKYY